MSSFSASGPHQGSASGLRWGPLNFALCLLATPLFINSHVRNERRCNLTIFWAFLVTFLRHMQTNWNSRVSVSG